MIDNCAICLGFEGTDGCVIHFHQINIHFRRRGIGDVLKACIGDVEPHAVNGTVSHTFQVICRNDKLTSREVIKIKDIRRNGIAGCRPLIHRQFTLRSRTNRT